MPPRYTSLDNIWYEYASDRRIDEIKDRTGWSDREVRQAHIEVFMSIPGMTETTKTERAELFQGYVENLVNGSTKEARTTWFREVGIHNSDFDWEAWRAAKGYSRNQQ